MKLMAHLLQNILMERKFIRIPSVTYLRLFMDIAKRFISKTIFLTEQPQSIQISVS